ncbi:MAG TPA: DeoR/GlpR family DNA-binding transcription regulator [Armatimonadota bacterium]|jgi:DeoR/GlpR family transcriptional regulator of sugar metabolism
MRPMETAELNQRQVTILELLRQGEEVSIRRLAGRFAVSEMTVRRDVRTLEANRLLIRTHGGGVAAGDLRFLQLAMPYYTASPIKSAIGRRAAELVQPGMTILLDEGTTTLEVARHIPKDAPITVATISLCVAQEFYGSAVEVVVFGGLLRKEFPSLCGPLTERMLRDFHVDMLFVGCDAARSNQGFFFQNVQLASLTQAMLRIADRVVVVTESQKFQRTAFMQYASIAQVDTIITDAGLPTDQQQQLRDHGATVITVD